MINFHLYGYELSVCEPPWSETTSISTYWHSLLCLDIQTEGTTTPLYKRRMFKNFYKRRHIFYLHFKNTLHFQISGKWYQTLKLAFPFVYISQKNTKDFEIWHWRQLTFNVHGLFGIRQKVINNISTLDVWISQALESIPCVQRFGQVVSQLNYFH